MIRLSRLAAFFVVLSLATMPFLIQLASAQDSTLATESAENPLERVRFSLRPAGDTEESYFNDVEVRPGETVTLEAAVINLADEPIDLRVYRANATNPDNGGFMAGKEDDDLFGSATWIDLETQEFTLDGGGSKILPFTVTVPESAAPGQYISSFIAETVDTYAIPGSEQFDHRIRYAMAVSILVPGELHYSFELGQPVLDSEYLRIPIENTGNYLLRPQGTLEIVDSQGDVILSSPVRMKPIYASLSTNMVIQLPTPLPQDEYVIKVTLEDPSSGASATFEESVNAIEEPEGVSD